MIYTTDFKHICNNINYLEVIKYLNDLSWKRIPNKRSDLKIFQKYYQDELFQVIVPIERDFVDYADSMYDLAVTLSKTENISVERIILELLNPMADILRLRIDNDDIKDGSILVEDALNFYEKAKKLLTYAAQDTLMPKKYHNGRPYGEVQEFIGKCRIGQTEMGSYIVNLVCPLCDIKENTEFEQLSIFDSEDRSSISFTRKVTNKLMRSLNLIKNTLDNSEDLEKLTDNDTDNNVDKISINFLESLQNLNINKEKSELETSMKWAPTVFKNRSQTSFVKFNYNYYKPLYAYTSNYKIRNVDLLSKKTYIGKIRELNGEENIETRKNGIIKLVSLEEENAITISAILNLDDYNEAVIAHKLGKYVQVTGTLNPTKKNYLTDCELKIIE
jgi:hypothetical protein